MSTITKPNSFVAGTVAVAADVNSNFDTIYNDYNGNITNANIAPGAAIVDTKLAQITTASKVHGSSLTGLASITSASGVIPNDNFCSVGTWTMGLTFGGGATALTYGARTGYYTKIGNLANVSGYLLLSNNGSSVGDALITGLPYSIYNNAAAYSGASLWLKNITFGGQFQGRGEVNSTTISLWDISEAGASTSLTNADFTSDSQIMVNLSYRIA